jgi:hypothetical protein
MMSQSGMMSGGQAQVMDAGWMAGMSDGGWTTPDGSVMPVDQPVHGCTYSSGIYQAPDGGYIVDGVWVGGGAGSADAGSGSITDSGYAGVVDGGSDGGSVSLAGGATPCALPASCVASLMPMVANYFCPDQTLGGPACVVMPDGTCAWCSLSCP